LAKLLVRFAKSLLDQDQFASVVSFNSVPNELHDVATNERKSGQIGTLLDEQDDGADKRQRNADQVKNHVRSVLVSSDVVCEDPSQHHKEIQSAFVRKQVMIPETFMVPKGVLKNRFRQHLGSLFER